MIFDYGTLKIIWWGFISTLFAMFFVLGGRDYGVCILLPLVGKTDEDRRLFLNSIGPTWEGNQVWFITAAASLFAAWPIVYATAFSGLYYAFLLVLFTIIIRPPSIDYRSKIPNVRWRDFWDRSLFISGLFPTFAFGLVLGNLLIGFPFTFNSDLQSQYTGTMLQLVSPLSILFGLAAVTIHMLHGGVFLQKKLSSDFAARLQKINLLSGSAFIGLFVILGVYVCAIDGPVIHSALDIHQSQMPIAKEVLMVKNGWLHNYNQYPLLWGLPITVVICALLAMLCSWKNFTNVAILMSTGTMVGALATMSATLFPFIFLSSSNPNHSLTVWDSASSQRTLQYMFWVAVIFLPIVMSYTYWVFRVMRGPVESKLLQKPESY
jgi:cytochrome d ubiquinol oxidase subunit II